VRRTGCAILVVSGLSIGAADQALALACTISPITGGYGTVDVLAGAAVDSTSSITVTCSGGSANQAIRLCLNIGTGTTALGPSNERTIRSSSDYIDAEFYFDSGRSQLWGSWGTGGASAYPTASPAGIQQDVTLNSSGNGTFNYTVYARIFANQQTKIPGSYSWAGSSPTVQYIAKSGAPACPTSGSSSDAGGSSFTATVNANANVSATTLNFGSTSSLASNIDSTATISVQATNTTPYSIGLGNGVNASGSQRRARKGATASFIDYDLYTDSARSQAWSTSTSTTSCTGGAGTCMLATGTGASQNTTVYGRVPTQTIPAAGTFTDTVVVTVTF
jgi:spore coat protein U-like protein